jgi:hypothetical protein
MISPCPETITEIDKLLAEISLAWAKSQLRPKLHQDVSKRWDQLIAKWISNKDLPLYIRKFNEEESRGQTLKHLSGRSLITTDNSPAHWSYMMAISGSCPLSEDLQRFINDDQIPVALAFKSAERRKATYTGRRNQMPNPNKLGWKICHKEAVGLKSRGSITKIPINDLETHFRLFLSPSNMFLVPKTLSGLGEIPHMVKAMQKYE